MEKLLKEKSWKKLLNKEFKSEYFLNLKNFIKNEYKSKTIYPPKEDIFKALNLSSFKNTKVIILGQDPYHGENQANGLAFSVNKDIKAPPSLKNIYKEIENDLKIKLKKEKNLAEIAKQGVLLLNTTLTVEKGKPTSHTNKGWEIFSTKIIQLLSEKKNNLVFILWGKLAEEKEKFIDSKKHLILKSSHPSPFSAHLGFFNSKHFSKTNNYLKSIGEKEINWEKL